ncbi:MAG TPA: type II secretion system protein [Mycobacterium sp.]|nr:type II secretion system protein [Mycobacterium sp.]
MEAKRLNPEAGFTLIELLVVIAILGILSAVVVFSVSGLTDHGEESACRIDKRTLQTAEEANFAQFNVYADEPTLVANGFLSGESEFYTVTVPGATKPYDIAPQIGATVACS